MRLFIAIELPRSFQQEVGRIQKEVKRASAGGKFVPTDNLHITLHFIGESKDLAGAAAAMRDAVRGIRPFTLHLGKCGCFEKGDSLTSIINVLGQTEELNALYESLQAALYDHGFARERKRFTPHVTLGRNVELDELAQAELARLSPNASMTVQSITLFESARQEGRMVYTPLHRE